MIIDMILDRKEIEAEDGVFVSPVKLDDLHVLTESVYPDCPADVKGTYCYHYTPRAFYWGVHGYGDVGEDIRQALDYGTEADVKEALCKYIDDNDYNPAIKDYINSVNWLEGCE